MSMLCWTVQARHDVMDIYVSIGLEHSAAAERFFDRIENKTHLLTLQPRMGAKRPDIRRNLRMMLDAPYLILYRIEPDDDTSPVTQVEIVRIVDGRRELSALL